MLDHYTKSCTIADRSAIFVASFVRKRGCESACQISVRSMHFYCIKSGCFGSFCTVTELLYQSMDFRDRQFSGCFRHTWLPDCRRGYGLHSGHGTACLSSGMINLSCDFSACGVNAFGQLPMAFNLPIRLLLCVRDKQ